MLNFLGIGSAFHTELGNTSAYIKKEHSLLLIDCGGTVFHQIRRLNLFHDIKRLYIIITHTHPDHIGSLGEAIFYAYYILKIKPIIYHPNKKVLETLFSCIGVKKEMVHLKTSMKHKIDDINFTGIISFINVPHTNTLQTFGFYLTFNTHRIYYSGDAFDIPNGVVDKLLKKELSQVYQDTCGLDYDGNTHLSINKLTKLIPKHLRKYVYCIHLDEHINTIELKELGFNIPTMKNN